MRRRCLIAGGLLLAIVPAWWLKGFIGTELYGVKPADPQTLALAASGLVGVGLLAAGLPGPPRRPRRSDDRAARRVTEADDRMSRYVTDLRLAARSLVRAPLFSLIAIASIALGIGASTAVFTLLDQVALRGCRWRGPASWCSSRRRAPNPTAAASATGRELSWPMYRDLRDRLAGVDGLFGRTWLSFHVGHAGRTERVEGELVSGNYFRGPRAHAGGGPAVHGRRRRERPAGRRSPSWATTTGSAASPAVQTSIGQAVSVNGHPLTVVGVAPRGFYGLELLTPAEVFVPLTMQPQMGPPWLKLEGRRFRWVQVFGRLADGTTIDTLRARLDPLYATLLADEATDPAFNAALGRHAPRLPRAAA